VPQRDGCDRGDQRQHQARQQDAFVPEQPLQEEDLGPETQEMDLRLSAAATGHQHEPPRRQELRGRDHPVPKPFRDAPRAIGTRDQPVDLQPRDQQRIGAEREQVHVEQHDGGQRPEDKLPYPPRRQCDPARKPPQRERHAEAEGQEPELQRAAPDEEGREPRDDGDLPEQRGVQRDRAAQRQHEHEGHENLHGDRDRKNGGQTGHDGLEADIAHVAPGKVVKAQQNLVGFQRDHHPGQMVGIIEERGMTPQKDRDHEQRRQQRDVDDAPHRRRMAVAGAGIRAVSRDLSDRHVPGPAAPLPGPGTCVSRRKPKELMQNHLASRSLSIPSDR
jgi:hypothetical protein